MRSIVKSALLSLSLLTFSAASLQAQIPPAQSAIAAPLRTEELDALLAPVALYPDSLLAQILMASTYPFEVAQAAQFVKANSGLKGQALSTQLGSKDWDDSVKALTDTPQVLQMMSERLDWMQKLGDAYLSQQAAVAGSVQRLRQRASSSGKLKSTEQQHVVTENQTIVIQQADPQVVYIPAYDPLYAYGTWPYAAYPPYPYYPYAGYGYGLAAAGVGFLAGAAIGNWWNNAHVDWHGGNININNGNFNRNNFNRNNIGNGNRQWQHNPEHRRGTNYRDNASRERFGKSDGLANARQDFRGRNPSQGALQNQFGGANRGQFGNGQLGNGQFGNGQFGNNGGSLSGRRGGGSSFDSFGGGAGSRVASDRGRSSFSSSSRSFGGGARSSGGFSRGGGGGFRGGGGRGGGGRR